MTEPRVPRSGRRVQASRNDQAILQAARAVFVADPGAPIAAVAHRAGVGISAIYRRYGSKEELLQTLCGDGLAGYIAAVEAALADEGNPWTVFVEFMRRVVDADTHSLTIRLTGMFTPTTQLYELAARADRLNNELLDRMRSAGAVRQDLEVADLGLIFEQLAAVRLGDEERTGQLRHRYLSLVLDALRNSSGTRLPGPAPTPAELAGRW